MGNATQHQKSAIDFLSEFKEMKKDSQGIVLQHNETKLTYFLKQYTFASDALFEKERIRLEKEANHSQCDNVIKVEQVKTHTIEGLCSTTHKIYAIYEYPQVNLQDEIVARKKENKRFDENQLWSILQSCTSALLNLKSKVSLTTQVVFITQEGELKVIHNDLFDDSYRYSMDPRCYYAPEKLSNFNKNDTEGSLIKEAVFSMGLTLLQTALLEDPLNCYDFQRNIFLDVYVEDLLQSLENQYSSDFLQILSLILCVDTTRRPTLTEVQKMLDNYWNSLQSENQSKAKNNGESLNIYGAEDQNRKFLFTSQQDKGILRNLATINSQQKQSMRKEMPSDKKSFCIPKISESIEASVQGSSQAQEQKCLSRDMIKIVGSLKETVKGSQSKQKKTNKENLYTDPKLLQMIRKDLNDISKLKQSTLKETIKYSFLYPEEDSIFKSIQDVKLSMKPLQSQSLNQAIPLEQSFPKVLVTNEHQQQIALSYQEFTDAEGHKYEGYTLNNMKQGHGKLTFEDGAYYEGNFDRDQINGRGVLFYCEGKPAFDGYWIDGQFHGEGILYNQNPQELHEPFNYIDLENVQQYWCRYIGEFDYDNKCGKGCLELTNGQRMEGIFQNDMVNGKGCFFRLDGSRICGVWEMNRLVHLQEK